MPREIERKQISRYMQKRVRPADVCFVIDATQSMDFVFLLLDVLWCVFEILEIPLIVVSCNQ